MSTSPPHRRTALLVAGMHRSGTSALGGVLAALGAQPPKSLMPPTKDNPRGYWESSALMQFHNDVLASAGSTWHDWSRFNPDWLDSDVAADYEAALPRIIEQEFGDARLFMVKDPRICRLLPLWLRVLGEMDVAVKVLLPIRHPLEVVRSLEARDAFVSSRSTLIWLRHVLDAERDSRGLDRGVIQYAEVLKDWRTQMRKVSHDIHLHWPKWSADIEVEIDQYLSAGLRHHSQGESAASQPQLAEWAKRCFDALSRLSRDGGDLQAMATLDAVRADFEQSSEIFATVARETELRAAREHRAREREAAEASRKLAAVEAQVEAVAAAADQKQRQHDAETAALSSSLADAERTCSALESELDALRGELTSRDQRVEEMQVELDVREQRLQEVASELDEARRAAEEAISAKNMELAERSGEIAALTRLLVLKEHAIEQAELERRALTLGIDKHKARIRTLEKQVAEARKQAAATQHSLTTVQGQLAAEQAALQQATEELARLRASASWRMTAPLRKIGGATRRTPRDNGTDGDLALVRGTELFDVAWYLASNPDVAAAGIDPAEHYLRHGAYEGRDPSPRFASRHYLDTYPDVAAVGMNPLVHYLRHGRAEGRTTAAAAPR